MNRGDILVVDDEGGQRDILRAILTAEGYQVETAGSAADAQEKSARGRFDLVLSDLRMPGADGLSLVRALTREDPPTLVILMTGYGSIDSAEQAMKQGAFDYLTKPLERDELLLTVNRAFERIRLIQENRLLRQQLEARFRVDGIVGSHFRIQEVFDKVHKVSGSSSTVLLYGESGTGKELVARAIHRHSPRKDRPFVGVSCAAIPETLIESELFGHEKGAFTGAVSRAQGLFEAADKSTLFLDEIGELSVGMQAKVLRALQERSTDIPQLAGYFVARACAEAGRAPMEITKEAMRLLLQYEWPGNVRQLEAVLQRAVLLSDGRVIDYPDLPIEVRFSTLPPRAPGAVAEAGAHRFPLPAGGINLEEVERDFLVQAMEQSGWVIAKAAKILGLSYRTLQYRLEKFQIHRGAAEPREPVAESQSEIAGRKFEKGGMA